MRFLPALPLLHRFRNEGAWTKLGSAAFRREVNPMLFWYPVLTLMADAIRVIEMRLQLIALSKGMSDEMFLMVTEKIDAMAKARAIIMRGGDPSLIMENYRTIIAANVARLSN
jgi:hypothetical protein